MTTSLSIFDFDDYRKFVLGWIKIQPKNGYGQLRKMALNLRLAPVTITQVFKGDRDLPAETAPALAVFLNLNPLERRFFINLVLLARAGSEELREFFKAELEDIRKESQQLKNRVPSQVSLSDVDLSVFHSSWIYSAIRLLTSIEGFNSVNAIAEKLRLPKDKISEAVEFLLRTGLCLQDSGGNLGMGPSRTHLPDDSPYVVARQISWRTKAFETMHQQRKTDLFYTAPMSLAEKDIVKVRAELLASIDRVNSIVGPSNEEELVCLNIDWFRI